MTELRAWMCCLLFATTALVGCETGKQPAASDGSEGAQTFRLTHEQASEVATVVAFLNAYNGGNAQDALALLSDDVGVSDCDYRQVAATQFSRKTGATDWLSQRLADHDTLRMDTISDANPQQPVGVVGITWSRRTSDTLRALGFRDGIRPQGGTKVIFKGSLISSLAMGPVGGNPSSCKPVAPA